MDGYNLFHYFKRSIGHHRLVAILALEGLVVDDYQCLRAQFVPIGGLTSAEDKNPLSMVLQNVPDQVNAGTSLEEAVAGITAIVSFEEGVTKTVTAEELQFTAIPNMNDVRLQEVDVRAFGYQEAADVGIARVCIQIG